MTPPGPLERAGGAAEILVLRNLTPADIAASRGAMRARPSQRSQMIVLPGGFSGGDEPDGSAKFITAFFRNARDARTRSRDLLEKRDGLMLGICNGFQALIKLGLVPFGKIVDTDEDCPTLTFNEHRPPPVHAGAHPGRLQQDRPWLMPHGRWTRSTPWPSPTGRAASWRRRPDRATWPPTGRSPPSMWTSAGESLHGRPLQPQRLSYCAIEGITSPDGRVLGKMGHTERSGDGLYMNVPGNKYQPLFEGGVDYFK